MTKRICLTLVIGCSCIFLNGCASTRQFVPLPDQASGIDLQGKSRIYVFRPEAMLGGLARMQVKDGERIIGDLGMRSYLCWERSAGTVTVFLDFYSSDDNVVTMREDLNAEAGTAYYLRAGLLTMNPFSADPNQLDRLWRIEDEEGKRLIEKCKPPPLVSQK